MPSSAPPSPTTAATPVMISHSCLVCLPAATKAWLGRVMASMKAQASTTNAATPRTRKKMASGVSEPSTVSRYLIGGTVWSVLGYSLRVAGRFCIGFCLCLCGEDGFQHLRLRAGRADGQLGRSVRFRIRCVLVGRRRVLPPERLVDLDEHLLLPFGELRVGQQRGPHPRIGRPVFQDPGLNVERFRRDAEPLGDLLQYVRARLTQATLDLAQIGVGHPGRLGQLAHRDLRLLPLLPDVLADRVDVHVTHARSLPRMLATANAPASTPGVYAGRAGMDRKA